MAADPMVSTAWLADRLDDPDVRIVDASWWMPSEGRDARAEYAAAHIPGAVFFDIDEIAAEDTPLPHMLPTAAKFGARMRGLGLGDGARIVVYDAFGVRSAARVWWTFRTMGHADVFVLDGGLPKWIAEGRPVTDRESPRRERHFTVRLDEGLVRDRGQVARALETGSAQVVDARSGPRFRGEAPEPRAGLRSGHMPGALNLPFTDLLAADGTLKPADELAARLQAAGVDRDAPVIASCGSGITACVIALALARLGHDRAAVYDGSWTEWAAAVGAPIVTG